MLRAESLQLELGGRLEQWRVGVASFGSALLWDHLPGQAGLKESSNRQVGADVALRAVRF